ncbi:MAG: hypothetical protein UHK54_02320 [Acutalibacteraceae bacterium]|nr:hypothetical protein [Acutalibacteraceae bacterium]
MKNKAVKFICLLLSFFITAIGILCAVAYILDPQNVYRSNTNGVRYFSPIYSTAPAIRTADYDCVIIGSSMVQNFDASEFASQLDCKPLKLALGALEPDELLWLYNNTQEQGKAKKYIINIDLHRFAANESVEPNCGRFPEYMYHPSGLSQFKYLLGYETWFRFIPLQLALTTVETLNIPLPESFKGSFDNAIDINSAGCWNEQNPPGEDALIDAFNSNTVVFNDGDSDVYSKNALANMDYFLDKLTDKLDSDEEIIIYLPPYSSLYWAEKNSKQLEIIFALREKIAVFAAKYDNIHLCDLQAESYVEKLDLYMDRSHASLTIRKIAQQAVITCTGEPTSHQIKDRNQTITTYANNALEKAKVKK